MFKQVQTVVGKGRCWRDLRELKGRVFGDGGCGDGGWGDGGCGVGGLGVRYLPAAKAKAD